MRPSTRASRQTGRCRSFTLFALVGLALLITTGITQGAQPAGGPYRLPPNLLEYLKDKYVDIDDFVIVGVQETPHGPLGRINASGRIRPTADVRGMAPDERARAIARAFIVEEAKLFGLANPSEIRESAFSVSDRGKAIIHYVRRIGELELVEWRIRIEVGADGAITRVLASLVPSPEELYRAVKREPISREQVMSIVESDLGRPGQSAAPTIYEPRLGATWRPPYVVWGASGSLPGKPRWAYNIDAFTGEILNKGCTAITLRAISGRTPCD